MTEHAASAPAEPEAVRIRPDIAAAALAFLDRATLQASEIEAFLRVRVALEAIALRGDQ